jgi:hypothetical protein
MMKAGKRLMLLSPVIFFLALGIVPMGGCNDSDNGTPSTNGTPSGGDSLPSVEGTWSGTWTDTRYNVSGEVTATFTRTDSTINATGTIDLRSLGLGNQPGTGSGTISGGTLNFTFSAAMVGSGQGSLTGNAASGSGTVTGPLNFGAFTFQGTATDDTINGTFDFTSPTGGNGVVTLTRQ